MQHDEFMEVRSQLNEYCTNLLEKKRREYSEGNVDRLNQFKRAGVLMNCPSTEALAGMMVKHETSIHDMIANGELKDEKTWLEKIGDLRNYCDLLYALLKDEGAI